MHHQNRGIEQSRKRHASQSTNSLRFHKTPLPAVQGHSGGKPRTSQFSQEFPSQEQPPAQCSSSSTHHPTHEQTTRVHYEQNEPPNLDFAFTQKNDLREKVSKPNYEQPEEYLNDDEDFPFDETEVNNQMNELLNQITPQKNEVEVPAATLALKNALFKPLHTIGSSTPLYSPTSTASCNTIFKIENSDFDQKGILILNNTQISDRMTHRDFGRIVRVIGNARKLLDPNHQLSFKEQQEKIHLLSFLCWVNFEFRSPIFLERTLGLIEKKIEQINPWGEHNHFDI